jgi:hypothetical protein
MCREQSATSSFDAATTSNFPATYCNKTPPDTLSAIAAALDGLIVGRHDADFKRYRDLFPAGYRTQARKLTGRIVLEIEPARAAARVSAVIELVKMQ